MTGVQTCALPILCGHNLRFDKLTKDLDERIAEFNKTHNNFYDYSFIENYKNIYSIIKIKCPEHGFFTQVAHNHWKGAQCPSCSNMFSKGSTKIQKVLSELNIEFFMEYTFNDLLHPLTKNKLRFDFYLPQQNIAIEFNGQQHYKESTWFSERNLEEQQLSDETKKEYCSKNKIKFIVIPYFKYKNIKSILIENL